MDAPQLWIALVHHPVLDRRGEVIAATVDHFDVFDAGRLSLTYPVAGVLVVHPEASQRALVERLIAHGTDAQRGEDRPGVLGKTRWVPNLASARAAVEQATGRLATLIATTAKAATHSRSFAEARAAVATGAPHLLLVGKASGLAPALLDQADLRLAPIDTGTGYNHLSVRSALAIVVDRLLGGAAGLGEAGPP